jgi:thymidylate synthase (FAD)
LNQYQSMIDAGVAPEQARMALPQSMMTSYYVTGSLAAFARAYKQRIDGHAQREIQMLAEQWAKVIEPLYPISWSALTND